VCGRVSMREREKVWYVSSSLSATLSSRCVCVCMCVHVCVCACVRVCVCVRQSE